MKVRNNRENRSDSATRSVEERENGVECIFDSENTIVSFFDPIELRNQYLENRS